MAVQEAMGVMGAAMLRQQGSMRDLNVWEMEMEDALRRIFQDDPGGGRKGVVVILLE